MKRSFFRRGLACVLAMLLLLPALPAAALGDGALTGGVDFDASNGTTSRLLYGTMFYIDWKPGNGLTNQNDTIPGRDCSGNAANGANPDMVLSMTLTFEAIDGVSDPAACWNRIALRLRSSIVDSKEQASEFYNIYRTATGNTAQVDVAIPLSEFGKGNINWADLKELIIQVPVEEAYQLDGTGDSPALRLTVANARIINYANMASRIRLEDLLQQSVDYTYDQNEAATVYEQVRAEAEALLESYADDAVYGEMVDRLTAAIENLSNRVNISEQVAVFTGQEEPYTVTDSTITMDLTCPAINPAGRDTAEWYVWVEGELTAPDGYTPPEKLFCGGHIDWYKGDALLRSSSESTSAREKDGTHRFRLTPTSVPEGADRVEIALSSEAWEGEGFSFALDSAGLNNGWKSLQTAFSIEYLLVEEPQLYTPTPAFQQEYEALCEQAHAMVQDRIWYSNDELQTVYHQLKAARHAWQEVSRGDLDNNMQITAADALLALQAATNKITLEDTTMANVDNQDGVTPNDALQILQFATKKITSFPTTEQETTDATGIVHAQDADGRYQAEDNTLAPDSSSVGFAEGGYLAYRGMDLGEGDLTTFMAVVSAEKQAVGKTMELRLDTPNSDPIATLTLKDNGKNVFAEQYATLTNPVSGVHDVYVTAPAGTHLDWFTLSTYNGTETAENKTERMAWWNDARFGMFIHWGAYANFPFDETGPTSGYTEWVQSNNKLSKEEYEQLVAPTFDPQNWDADAVVQLAQDAGQKYIVFTSKHHEGYSMFETEVTGFKDFSLLGYGVYDGADPLMELAEASKAAGIPLGCYYSTQDWRHSSQESWATSMLDKPGYVADMKAQLRELIENYDLDILWFDGEWQPWWTTEDGQDLYRYLRTIKPSIILNNRIGKRADTDGDFGTPEQQIPAGGLDYDWESCITMNGNWGYAPYDHNWKSPTWIVQSVVDTASKGGNILLNIGPDEQGAVPEDCAANMRTAGEWFAQYGESIYGTTASPFAEALSFGAATKKDGRLYLHVTKWPQNGKITIPAIKNTILGVQMMGATTPLAYTVNGDTMTITLPNAPTNAYDSVVEVLVEGVPTQQNTYTYSDNYALNKPTTVSNHYQNNTQYNGSAAVDGDNTTRWATDDDVTACWLEVDLGEETTFNTIKCSEYTGTGGQRVTAYNIEYWDGSQWQIAHTGTDIGGQHTARFDATTAQKVRLHILTIDENAKGGPSIWEFGVYTATIDD